MRKNFLAILLAVCLIHCLSVTAFAADGEAPTLPGNGRGGETAGTSTGAATVTHNGTNFQTENDDDSVAKDDETTGDGTNIAVWAKIAESSEPSSAIVYSLDVAWGAMSFEFSRGAGVWNPESHAYDAANADSTGWTMSKIDGANNKITVTNHTNSAINATFAVALNDGVFNAVAGPDNVVGNFFADNIQAEAAAGKLTAVADVADEITSVTLETAAAYSDGINNEPAGERIDDVFFAFSGTPDASKTIDEIAKVGTITITFARNNKTYQAYEAP